MSSILRSKIEKTGLKLMAVILILSAIMTMVPVTARAAGDDWLVASASARQTVTIDNPTGTTLTDMPVLLRLASANIPEKGGVSFYQGETRLSAELANWNPSGKSEFWVKVPTLAANADTEITAYYSETTVAGVSASDVWSDDYALVQHFSQESVTAGKDSTGRNSLIQTGALAYKQTETGAAATFGGTQKLTYGNVAGGAERISISAVVDIPRVSTNWQGIICRYDNSKPAAERAFLFGLENTGKSYNRFYGSANPERILADTPVSPGIHLFTTTYNGTMARVYVDGNLKVSETLVNGTFYSGASSPLTIGAYSNSTVMYPFNGDIYDAFVKTTDISAEEEQFRYANYLGNIVTVLPEETKNGKISLRITNPRPGETLETGIHTVTGAISSAATLSYTLNGSAPVDVGSFAMGTFAFDAPFYALGENTLSVTAADTSDAQNTKTVSVSFTCADTAPPRQPALSSADDGGGSVTLNAQIEQESVETTAVTFYGLKTLPLTSQNTTVYSGATASETPFALTASGAEEASPFPPGVEKTTAGQNKTPYQIYEIALDEAARQINQFRVCWSGNTAGAPREVTMYVYNHAQNQWAKAGSGYSEDSFSIEATVENTAGLLNDGKLTLLVWRGMNEPIEGRRSYIPSNPGQYDFNLMWTTDTQFYAETPSYMFHLESQFNWIADHFKALKSRMLLNTGDIVNVYNDHAQWEAMSSVYEIIENAKIPHAMITGNHDVPDKTTTANNIYANYFPAERLMENNPYFSGHMGNENYYYLMEENGAKFLIMGIGLQIKQADVDWANGILAQYPDRFAILLYHDYLLANGNIDHAGQYADVAAFRKIVTANENVRLILCGHWAGAETNLEDIGGRPVYAILQDYQGLAQGGLGYFRMLKFDVENGLLYVNTYSETMGNNAYFTGVQGAKTGLYQLNKDEYALRLDFGAHQSRTLTTESLSVSNAGASSPIGAAQSVTGPGSASVIWNGLDGESNYAWHVVLRDEAGNETTSPVKTFFTESTEAPMSLPIEGNSIWKYNDTNTNLDTAWRAESFDDSAWKTGKGPLGYPASDSNSTFGPVSSGTLVNNLSNPNAYITYYFRKTFDIAAEDLAKITKLELTVGIDDGYVMYINGTEVRRLYMPDGELGWQTWATYVNEPSSQQGTDTADIT
ncbi:MAG: metallophosphoesterase, partial [Oscillospiraceae bacterium]|nr:metallophosphoesterase [Oscillospiraceae bacterium]